MFASFCRRRRLLLHIHKIPGGGTNSLQPIPAVFPSARSYSLTFVAGVANSQPCPATVSYLVSCGLSPAAAASTCRKRRISSTVKADAVRALLSQYGFADTDIVRIVRSAPTVLTVDPERILRPKLDFFASLGFEPGKLASSPCLLERSLVKHIIPSIQFLRDIIGSDDDIRIAFHRTPRALMVDHENYIRPAVEALRRGGLSEAAISKLLVIQLGVFLVSPDRISKVFKDLEEIGMCIGDPRFLSCFRVMCDMKRETWMQKLALYMSFGLTGDEVFNAFKTQPTIFHFGDENIKKKARFFLDELKLGIHDIIARPVILGYSLENCILPRCAVLSVLMREGRIQRDIKLLPALLGSSSSFSTRYVLRHADDVPDVVQ